MDTEHWDAMYRGRDQVFSGNPNAVLVAEAAGLPPGRALDAGCGEGADARWLARRGWQVTAVDVSGVALRRARATDAGGRVTWQRADLLAAPPPAGAYDLVSVHYFPLRRRPGHAALRGLLDAVAPGGTLLFATHALAGLARHGEPGFDPADYYQPGDIAGLLAPDWEILADETRPRTAPPPAGTHHAHDAVLRARRPG
ncbi:class I SAM-dependent methyltransferase [Streptomyces sp. CMB-StM0423]|uniref:class I SAM-dependent methyltransferase n=1 Tax=Streptomyces sp. CMB-StM0423 TaxID=2059884 RepID=UPI000C7062B0|nr:class I SAM-dependent methyltransferase [Streptomyces sp. CMB-StM0423]AUH42625.1 SAM-dependent methyltransferase [Streptomyces sp. CMB-StM0423]